MQKVKLYDFTVHYARPDGTKDSVTVSHVRDPQHAIEVAMKYLDGCHIIRAERVRK